MRYCVRVLRRVTSLLLGLGLASCSVMEVAHDIPCTVGGEARVARVWISCDGPQTGLYFAMFDYLLPVDVVVSPVASVVGWFDPRARTRGSSWWGPLPHVAAMLLPGLTSVYDHWELGRVEVELPAGATPDDLREVLETFRVPRRYADGEGVDPGDGHNPLLWGRIGEIHWVR